MTALAEFTVTQARPRSDHQPGTPGPRPTAVSHAEVAADQSRTVRDRAKTMRSWPLLVLAVPAAAEVWSGWVGIAQKTGFGTVSLLPGIWPSLHLDTAVTLPVGVECYAAYALRAWLAANQAISDRTRRFARRSAVFSLTLGMAGQIAFHLMNQDKITRAPWPVTTLVSCLPVLILGMGTVLAHMLREDASAARDAQTNAPGPALRVPVEGSPEEQSGDQPDQTPPDQTAVKRGAPDQAAHSPERSTPAATEPLKPVPDVAALHVDDARRIARQLAKGGQRISRRTLRSKGIKGSNEALNALSRSNSAARWQTRRPVLCRNRTRNARAGTRVDAYLRIWVGGAAWPGWGGWP